MLEYCILVQARMSSKRLPGKVLKPFGDTTVLGNLIGNLKDEIGCHRLIIVTSNHHSDDPIEQYCAQSGIKYFRGDLNDVYFRFVSALSEFECDYFFRLCGDSPLFPVVLVPYYLRLQSEFPDCDIISNTAERTFPKGYSLELVRSEIFKRKYFHTLNDELKEHVTPLLYKTSVKLVSVTTAQKFERHYAVDTMSDYMALSSGLVAEPIEFNQIKVSANY